MNPKEIIVVEDEGSKFFLRYSFTPYRIQKITERGLCTEIGVQQPLDLVLRDLINTEKETGARLACEDAQKINPMIKINRPADTFIGFSFLVWVLVVVLSQNILSKTSEVNTNDHSVQRVGRFLIEK
jgi:hypothetical protein